MRKNKIQLFILHFAGGNAYSFQFLKPYLPLDFDFHPLELPGRGKRIKEEPLSTEPEAVEDLVTQIVALRKDQPYLICGHSMGASLGLKVTKKLEELRDPPNRLIVLGNAGPGIGKQNKYRSTMNDEELKEELKILGGAPEEVLNNDELFDFFAPLIRSDFKLLENEIKLAPFFKINAPIVAIMGDQEETSEEIENWKNFTFNEFKFYIFKGNHFFIYDHPLDLAKVISDCYDTPDRPTQKILANKI